VLILGTFAGMATLGAILLSFPAASQRRPAVVPRRAVHRDQRGLHHRPHRARHPNAFTDFGLVVIMILVQLGGLGIMVLSTFATVLLGGRLALRSEQALEEVLDLSSPRAAYELVRFIVICTFALEALGAASCCCASTSTACRWPTPPGPGCSTRSRRFATRASRCGPTRWSRSRPTATVLFVHMTLILAGALGFPVLAALWLRARGATRRFSLQTRVVLWMTLHPHRHRHAAVRGARVERDPRRA
jgi:trk system potassium uptake protein TrkH